MHKIGGQLALEVTCWQIPSALPRRRVARNLERLRRPRCSPSAKDPTIPKATTAGEAPGATPVPSPRRALLVGLARPNGAQALRRSRLASRRLPVGQRESIQGEPSAAGVAFGHVLKDGALWETMTLLILLHCFARDFQLRVPRLVELFQLLGSSVNLFPLPLVLRLLGVACPRWVVQSRSHLGVEVHP